VRQHVVAEYPSASVALPICLAAPRASRRAMRRTDFCLLTSSYEHPRLRRFPMRQPLSRLRSRRDRLFHGSAIRFGGQHVLPGGHRGGLVVPVAMRACRTSDIPVASPSCVIPLARNAHPRKPPRPSTAHPRERCEQGRRSEMPSVLQGSLAPRRSLERPAQDLPGLAVWPPHARFSTPFHPRMPLRAPEGRAPVHVPRCQRESRFFEPRRRLPTSAT